MESNIYSFTAKRIDGKDEKLSKYKDKVLLIVNTASQCGFTPQYKGLEELYKKYQKNGFEIFGFPCNQFGGQEPENEAEINKFCEIHFGVTFPLFSKIDVNGKNTHPLYQYLKKQAHGFLGSSNIKWNFTKFLIDKNGHVMKRIASATKPEDIDSKIARLLEM